MTTHALKTRQIDATPDHGAAVVLELTGEIDATNAGTLDEALQQASASSGSILLDLSAVDFFDSAGFEVLDRRLAEGALSIVISPHSMIRRAASLVKLPFHDSVADAVASLAAT